jgi:hypothetical protein
MPGGRSVGEGVSGDLEGENVCDAGERNKAGYKRVLDIS